MFRKSIAMLLALCTCVGLVACQRANVTTPDQTQKESQYETVYNFEKTIRPVSMNQSFGVITVNEDAQYVSEGGKSLKLTPTGTVEDFLYAYFPFKSDMLGVDYTNLSYITEIKLDIYAQEQMNVEVGLYFSETANLRAEPEKISLIEGWNSVVVPVEHSLIALQYPLENCYGLFIQFEASASEKGQSVWLDNIRVLTSKEPAETEANIILDERDDYCEMADFEHAYQQIIVFPYTTYNKAQLPDVKVVKAADYNLEAASGEKVLRIESYPSTSYGNGSSWTQLSFSAAWFEALDISRFNASEYELKFDVYQEGDISTLVELNLYHSYGMDWGGIITEKGVWKEFSAPLTNFQNWMTNPGSFVLSWMDWNPELGDSCVFYLDNFRLEKIS